MKNFHFTVSIRARLRNKAPTSTSHTPQDPKAAGITHIVVGKGGLASLPPQLLPGGARLATSSAGRSTSASPSTQQLQRRYVNEHWLARCLAKQQLLPTEDYPPPDPEAGVPTPTAGGSELAFGLDSRLGKLLLFSSV